MKNSFFDGTTLQLIGWTLLVGLLTIVTFGFGAPWGLCMMERWRIKHTVVSSTRLKFVGTGGELFWIWIFYALAPTFLIAAALGAVILVFRPFSGGSSGEALLLLIIIACIVMAFYPSFVKVQIQKWMVTHTEFESYPANWVPAQQTRPSEGDVTATSIQTSVAKGPEIAAEGLMEAVLSLGTLCVGVPVAIAGLGLVFAGRFLEGGILFGIGIVLLLVSYFKQ